MNDKHSDGVGTMIFSVFAVLALFIFIVSSASPVQAAEKSKHSSSNSQSQAVISDQGMPRLAPLVG